mmetsp:Transcript_10186/g.22603  ORF Transcript_10186/g.22603 Transcript_10186/m.22603 type:complete len:400 (-) Transcript_10186:47-1246(-)
MVVARGGHGATNQFIVLGKTIGQTGDARNKELGTLFCLARIKEVQTSVSTYRPIGMLSTAIDSRKGLFVEQDLQAQLLCFSVHDLHEEHIGIAGDVGRPEDRGHLVLPGRHLIVLHGHGAADLQHLVLSDVQKLLHLPRNRLEVVQVALLVASWQLAEQGASGIHQVGSGLEHGGGQHEELLFPSQIAVHGLGISTNVDGLQQTETRGLDSIHGAQQRGLLVDAFAKVSDKSTRDVEALVHHEGWRCAIPGGEGSGRVGHAQATVGEGTAIRLALKEAFMRQTSLHGFGRILGAEVQIDQGVSLERTQHTTNCTTPATEREEPVRKVDGTQLSGPAIDGICDDLLVFFGCWITGDQALVEALHHRGRQLLSHQHVVKHELARCGECVGCHGAKCASNLE